MSLIISVAFFAAVLLASGTSSANQSDWTRARLACDDVGIDPNSLVSNLRISAAQIAHAVRLSSHSFSATALFRASSRAAKSNMTGSHLS
jgi:hypothetical protein